MLKKLAVLGSLGLAMVVPGVARADDDDYAGRIFGAVLARIGGRFDDRRDDKHEDRHDDKRGHHCDRADCQICHPELASRVWIDGHYETREVRRVIPAVTREEWVPDRCEVVCIPAVTERVCIPAVTERVWCPPVTERCWVPEVRDRCWVPAHWESSTDSRGCTTKVWISGHYEERIVRAGHYEERTVRAGRYDERVVRPERWETRIVKPECRETRVIEKGHMQCVVVRPERTEVTCEKVFVPGHWEQRGGRPGC